MLLPNRIQWCHKHCQRSSLSLERYETSRGPYVLFAIQFSVPLILQRQPYTLRHAPRQEMEQVSSSCFLLQTHFSVPVPAFPLSNTDQKCCVNFVTPLKSLPSYHLSFMVLTHWRPQSCYGWMLHCYFFFLLNPTQGFAIVGEILLCMISKFELLNFILVLLIQLLRPSSFSNTFLEASWNK